MKKQTKNQKRKQQRSTRMQIAALIFMFLTKTAMSGLSVAEKIALARRIIEMMTGNPHFTTPEPSLAEATTVTDALQFSQNKLPGSPQDTEARNQRLKEFEEVFMNLQRYVEFTAKGNREIILSSGMFVRDADTTIGLLPAPNGLSAISTSAEGQIKLKWEKVSKRTSYVIEWTTDPSSGIVFNNECTKTSFTINGLVPGQKYYFRVATVGAAGRGDFSPWAYCRPN